MPIDVLVGLQWGDEGKGKIIDILSPEYNIVARFQGGPNAGHTLVINDKKYVFHSLPSGVIHPQTINILGSGMVIDPVILKKEIETITKEGAHLIDRLIISRNAHIILPSHRMLDSYYEELKGDKKIGSTLKGIGPTYQDKIGRVGIRAGDLNSSSFKTQYDRLKSKHLLVLNDERIEKLNSEEKDWFEAIEFIKQFRIIDTEVLINESNDKGASILAEGAQGALLDINFGTYPYVTSSGTIAAGSCTGLGIAPNKIRNIFGVFKAYSTRVGEGPFLTEQKNEIGKILQTTGCEYGSTTGRERRCGWLDLVALKYSLMLNGVNKLIITKSDVLSSLDKINVCTRYTDQSGKNLSYNDQYYNDKVIPEYEEFASWKTDLSTQREFKSLPSGFKSYIEFIEKQINLDIWMISVGPERSQTLLK